MHSGGALCGCEPVPCLPPRARRHRAPGPSKRWQSPNLLVDAGWRVKVSDFNLSRILEESSMASTMGAMNPRCELSFRHAVRPAPLRARPAGRRRAAPASTHGPALYTAAGLAPELLSGGKATVKADVFAFGVVMW